MVKTQHDALSTPPKLLAKVMELSESQQEAWGPQDLGAVFQHQMGAPIGHDLRTIDPSLGKKFEASKSFAAWEEKTFRDLLEDPDPPLEVLEFAKRFAKISSNHPEGALPVEVSVAVYLASITAALVRCNERITQLDDGVLQQNLGWVLSQEWLDTPTRNLFEVGLDMVKGAG